MSCRSLRGGQAQCFSDRCPGFSLQRSSPGVLCWVGARLGDACCRCGCGKEAPAHRRLRERAARNLLHECRGTRANGHGATRGRTGQQPPRFIRLATFGTSSPDDAASPLDGRRRRGALSDCSWRPRPRHPRSTEDGRTSRRVDVGAESTVPLRSHGNRRQCGHAGAGDASWQGMPGSGTAGLMCLSLIHI